MPKQISIPVITLLLFLISVKTLAQQKEYISGRLFDSKTEEPIVFANIRIKDRALGIITNVDGSFRIPLRYKEYGDIIEISSMGYQTKEIPIADFSENELNTIQLDPGIIDLQETVVKGKDRSRRNLNAKQIVQRAIDYIPENYPSTAFSTIGYYRDYQFENEKYINLNEAILEVFDQGFDQLDDPTSEIRLFSFALNTDFGQDSLARMAYDYNSLRKIIKKAHLEANGGNEFRILRIHDAIRNYNMGSYDFVGVLKTDFIENHFFQRSSDTKVGNEELYTIKFWVFHPNYRANGIINISKSDFAIHRLEYTMYDDKKRNTSGNKNKHGHRQKVIFDITTDYRRIDGQMYLNYISFHNSFVLNIPPVFKVNYVTVDLNKRCFVVEYSDVPETTTAMQITNYTVDFDKKRLKLKSVERLKNKVFLYPKMEDEKITKMIEEITEAEKIGVDLRDLVKVDITDVRDTRGNLVNRWTQKDYQQFREFFVQRVKPDSRAPLNERFMDKEKAIFKDQPLSKPIDYNEYWMNTPLIETIDQ